MERKLASVQIIRDLQPIEGKDRIVLATIEGFHVIVGKEDFKIGDKCIYIECDSVLDPNNPIFEQARKRSNRVKTIKMAGIYSQGIAYPLSAFGMNPNDWNEGDDVTEKLHITKYDEYAGDDVEVFVSKKPKYNWFQRIWYRIFGFPKHKGKSDGFPTLISKTDEIRIQNIPEALNYKEPVVVTEKVDGCSMSAVLEHVGWFGREKFTLASRNRSLEKDNSHYWKAAEKYNLKEKMSLMLEENGGRWIAIQGEVAGPSIQKNPYGLKDIDFYIFNIIDENGRWGTEKMMYFCYRYGLQTVPVIDMDYILPDNVDGMLQYATNKSLINPTVLREGVVIRSKDGKKSFKAVSPEYLIKHNK
jgi:hypothetical protein